MMGPVSSAGRAMMSSLKQAMAKGMPLDQALAYVKSLATQGVAPLSDLYVMMLQAQKLQQPRAQAPQTPPTVRDNLNMAAQQREQQDQMAQGIGGLNAGNMENPGFYGGGIVSFDNGGTAQSYSDPSFWENIKDFASAYGTAVRSPFGSIASGETAQALSEATDYGDQEILNELEGALRKGETDRAAQLESAFLERNRRNLFSAQRTLREMNERIKSDKTAVDVSRLMGTPPPTEDTGAGRRDTGSQVPPPSTGMTLPELPEAKDPGLNPFLKMIEEAQKERGIGGASERARKMLAEEAAEEKRLTPEQKNLARAMAGFKMAEAYSRRGRQRVSGLGGLAEAGASYTSSLQNINKELRDAGRARRREEIALARADEAQAAGNIQLATAMREAERGRAEQRIQSALQHLNDKMDRDLKARLGVATIEAQDRNTFANIKYKAMKDYSERVENLNLNSSFKDLTPEQQNKYLKDLYESMVGSVISNLTGGGTGGFAGFRRLED